MVDFNIGDIVVPYWVPGEFNPTDLPTTFLYEVVRFDGSYVVCKPLSGKREYHYGRTEITVNRELTKDKRLRELCI